jgi:hypothetical protein
MPDNNYSIEIEFIGGTTGITTNSSWYLVTGTKLANSMQIGWITGGVNIVSFNWTVREVVNITAT